MSDNHPAAKHVAIKSPKKTWIWVVVIIGVGLLLCAGAGVGGYFWWKHKHEKKNNPNSTPTHIVPKPALSKPKPKPTPVPGTLVPPSPPKPTPGKLGMAMWVKLKDPKVPVPPPNIVYIASFQYFLSLDGTYATPFVLDATTNTFTTLSGDKTLVGTVTPDGNLLSLDLTATPLAPQTPLVFERVLLNIGCIKITDEYYLNDTGDSVSWRVTKSADGECEPNNTFPDQVRATVFEGPALIQVLSTSPEAPQQWPSDCYDMLTTKTPPPGWSNPQVPTYDPNFVIASGGYMDLSKITAKTKQNEPVILQGNGVSNFWSAVVNASNEVVGCQVTYYNAAAYYLLMVKFQYLVFYKCALIFLDTNGIIVWSSKQCNFSADASKSALVLRETEILIYMPTYGINITESWSYDNDSCTLPAPPATL